MKAKILLSLLCGVAYGVIFCVSSYSPDDRPPAPVPRRPGARRGAGQSSVFLRKLPPKASVRDGLVSTVETPASSAVASDRLAKKASLPSSQTQADDYVDTKRDVVKTVVASSQFEVAPCVRNVQELAVERSHANDRDFVQVPPAGVATHIAATVATAVDNQQALPVAITPERVAVEPAGDGLRLAVALPVADAEAASAAEVTKQDEPLPSVSIDGADKPEELQLVALSDRRSEVAVQLNSNDLKPGLSEELPIAHVAEHRMSVPEQEPLMVAQADVESAIVLKASDNVALEGDTMHNIAPQVVPTKDASSCKTRLSERAPREILQRDSDVPFPLHGIAFQNFNSPLPKTAAGYRTAARKHKKRRDRRARSKARRGKLA